MKGRSAKRSRGLAAMLALWVPVGQSGEIPLESGIVVYDLEFTAWDGSWQRGWSGPGEHREIVQIGAVRLGANLEELAAFEVLVRPRINPTLSAYFTDLTGITQAEVDARGVDIAEAMERFSAFAQGHGLYANGGCDERVMAENCALAGIAFPFTGRCRNVSGVLAQSADSAAHVESGAIAETFGLDLALPAHDALADARSIAAALRHIAARSSVAAVLAAAA